MSGVAKTIPTPGSEEDLDPQQTLRSLTSSLDDLETQLAPLLNAKWSDTITGMSTLERAKMDVLVSYAINDLIWGGCSSSSLQFSLIVICRRQ